MVRLPAIILIWLICLPLAIFAGYSLATPLAFRSLAVVGMVLGGLALPLLLKWHHALLIFSWNSFLIVIFLPSQPSLGLVMALISFGMSLLARTMDKNKKFISVPQLTLPMLFLAAVIIETVLLTGGVGIRILGSEQHGGKRAIYLLGAILGYFAFTAQRVPRQQSMFMSSMFFLSGATGAISDIAYSLGPNFYFLFLLTASNIASMQAVTQETLLRFSGLSFGALAICYTVLLRYGIAGSFERPWRLGLFLLGAVGSLFGGYRASIIALALVFGFLFYYEGLFRTKFFGIFGAAGALVAICVLLFVDKMPLSVQRSLSFLPLNVDASARQDAEGTLEWRLQIWKTVLPDVPKYLLVGKGYNFNATDYYLTQEAMRRGMYNSYEDTLISGNYHNGILTTIIPLGALGMIAFLWLVVAGYKVLYKNYLYGDPELRRLNTFLLAYYMARVIFYFVFYGQLDGDLAQFAGIFGLSVSLNGGVAQPEKAVQQVQAVQAESSSPILSPVV